MKDVQAIKIVVINRAVSGSGKTTLSKCISRTLEGHGLDVAIHSTDQFFMKGNRYVFELAQLSGNHEKNLQAFKESLQKGVAVVFCDNMNLLPWQSQPYTDLARGYGYKILFLNFLPRSLEKHLAAQVVTDEKPDAHNLSETLIREFIKNFHEYNDLLDIKKPRDPERHRQYRWDEKNHCPVESGGVSPYFDCDVVITIDPDAYHALKTTIGDKVLNIIKTLAKKDETMLG